jgi:hypothetical protein
MTPSATNFVSIQMYSGTYTEVTPIIIPAFVSVTGLTSSPNNVIIRPADPAPTGSVITLNGNTRLYGIVIECSDGNVGNTDIGILANPGSADILDSVTVRNALVAGIKVSGDGTQFSKLLSVENSLVLIDQTITMTSGWEVESGATLTVNNCSTFAFGTAGVMTNGIYIHDQYSEGDLNGFSITVATVGIKVGGGTTSTSQNDFPLIRGLGIQVRFATSVGIMMDAKSAFRGNNVSVEDNTAVFPSQIHLQVTEPSLPSNPNIIVGNFNFRQDLVTFLGATSTNPSEIRGFNLSETPGEIQTIFGGEVSIGTVSDGVIGAQFASGEGDHSIRGMVVLKDDGGVFTDVTDDLKFPSPNLIDVDLTTTASIDLASAPATIDGATPTSGVTRVLVKDGSTANPGSTSVDNGIYLWNGTGAAMTRTTDFASGSTYTATTWFHTNDIGTPQGDVNYGSLWKLNTNIIVATTSFSLVAYSTKVFPDPPVNDDAFYIGNSNLRLFPGFEVFLSTSMINVAGTSVDSVIWEFWNGSIWTELPLMSTYADAPYTTRANVTLENDTIHHYRFGDIDTWATTTVNGTLAYWVRSRVIDAANITKIPVVGQIKLHTNHTHIGKDGFVEYFGDARPTNDFNIAMSSVLQTGIAGITNPGSQELLVVDAGGIEIAALGVNNLWATGVDTAVTFIWNPPANIDTSNCLNLKIPMSRSTTGAGNIALSVEYAFVVNEDVVKNPNGGTTAVGKTTGVIAYPTSTIARGAFFVTIPLTITDLLPSDSTIWFKLTRVGTDGLDTYGNSVYPHNILLQYKSWSAGGF